MTEAIDFLASVRPKSKFYELVAAKKPLLNRLMAEVEGQP